MKTPNRFRLITIILIAVIFGIIQVSFAQPPQAFKYQSIVRNDEGNPMANAAITIRATIHDGAETGPAVYQETHAVTTNLFGLVNLQIGNGTIVSGNFPSIAWGSGSKWMEIEADFGTGYVAMGTSELLSVPYALFCPNGAPGTTGITGAQGNAGVTGSVGTTGVQGIVGVTGSNGATGSQGNIGVTGSVGSTGMQGIAGITGSSGSTGSQGIAGTTGSTGATGTQGIDGIAGSTGALGSQGNTGNTGITGNIGTSGTTGGTGSNGTTGSIGNTGEMGSAGNTGSTGSTGNTGSTGSTGSTGATGSIINNYAEFYALMPGDNAATIAVGAAVLFPVDGESDGVITSTTDSEFNLPDIGTYQVFFQVSVSEAGQLVLGLNGIEISRTKVGRATGTSQIVGMSLIKTISTNSKLTVLNPTGNIGALTITTNAGGASAVSANLVIMRIK